jgi:hypothetical protein
METKKIQKQYKTLEYKKLFKKQLTDPITGNMYIYPIALDCGCTYDRYTLCEKLLSDDHLFFKCFVCEKIHSKGIISRLKINKQLDNILNICFPVYVKELKTKYHKKIDSESVNNQVCDLNDETKLKNSKLIDSMNRLKKFDWISRLNSILDNMSGKKINSIKYEHDDVHKSLFRWIDEYQKNLFIKEYADTFMNKKGIELIIVSDGDDVNTVEIKCK